MIVNEDQTRVIEHPGPKLSVVAPAGSGKTTVLVERFVRHVVKDGITPDQVLTVTFTRKAAAEMKARIVQRLTQEGLYDHAQAAETGPIQTINSFYVSLLKQNAVAAGTDPALELEVQEEATHLRQALERAVLDTSQHSREAQMFLAATAGKSTWSNRGLGGQVKEMVLDDFADKLRGGLIQPQRLWATYRDVKSYTNAAQAYMLARFPGLPQPEPEESLGKWLARNRPILRSLGDVSVWNAAQIDFQAAITVGLAHLAITAWQEHEALLARRGACDFQLSEALAVELIKNNEDVRQKLQRDFKALLVDEAQDLSPAQHILFQSTGIERQMYVGDPQQSIYGFRQADQKFYMEQVAGLPTVNLKVNYRSNQGILNFANLVFGDVWKEEYAPLAHPQPAKDGYHGVEVWTTGSDTDSSVARHIANLYNGPDGPQPVTVLVRTWWSGESYARILTKSGVPCRFLGKSTRLVYRPEVHDAANLLTAATDPENDYALACLTRSPFVGLSLDSTVLLAHQGSIAASLPTFEPPVPEDAEKIADFLAWFTDLAKVGDRVSAWECLTEAIRGSDYMARVAKFTDGEHSIAYMRRILALAAENSDMDSREFAEYIRTIQFSAEKIEDVAVYEDDAPVVSFATVHATKGLEYENVVIADLDRLGAGRRLECILNKRTGLAASRTSGRTPLYAAIHAEAEQAEIAEANRLLYVAMTRAKSRLCICLGSDPSRPSAATVLVRRAIGYPDSLHPSVQHRPDPAPKPDGRL